MNIFYTDHCPQKAAIFLSQDRKRHSKMILESVQLLSTAINLSGGQGPYKTSHKNHPCNIWVRASRQNFQWLLKYTDSLFKLYQKMYGVTHKSGLKLTEIAQNESLIVDKGYSIPPNCAASKAKGLDYTNMEITKAYREYLKYQWEKEGIL